MNVPTYQQLLAEQYEENARNVLVFQKQYEDEDDETGDVEYDSRGNYEDREVPNPEEFNKFQGDRGKPEHVIQPKPTDKSKSSIKRDTDVRNIVLNIDSMFRGSVIPSVVSSPAQDFNPGATSSWFIFSSSQLYKNIASVKLTSVEFPNTFYSFAASRGNTSFTLTINSGPNAGTSYPITITDGNYLSSNTVLTLDPSTLITAIEDYIQTTLGFASFSIDYDPVSHRINFTNNESFTITFPTSTSNPYKNGIGYNLGFYQQTYNSVFNTIAYEIVSDVPPDVIQDKYIYIQINDWNLVHHQNINQTSFPAFAKIQLPGTKNTMIFDGNYLNSSTKEYFFQQPVNIQRLEIKLLDAFGNVLETDGENWAMTVELRQVNDSSTYEALNEL
jgi:hypothetical protein